MNEPPRASAFLPKLRFPESDVIILREWSPSDAGYLAEASADPYIPLVTTLPSEYSEAAMQAWIERQRNRRIEGAGYSLCIADATTDIPLGMIGFWLPELVHGRARIGYWVLPGARGHGVASSALSLVARWGFSVFPSVHRIELLIEPGNLASLRTAERAGFLREGLLRSYQYVGDTRRDFYMYSLLRPIGETEMNGSLGG